VADAEVAALKRGADVNATARVLGLGREVESAFCLVEKEESVLTNTCLLVRSTT
jgi:hypothetical protein